MCKETHRRVCQRQQQEPEHPKKGCGECYNTHTQNRRKKNLSRTRPARSIQHLAVPSGSLCASFLYIYMNAHTYPVFFNGTPFLRLVYMFFFFNNIKRSFNFLPPVGRGRERKGLKKIHQKDDRSSSPTKPSKERCLRFRSVIEQWEKKRERERNTIRNKRGAKWPFGDIQG